MRCGSGILAARAGGVLLLSANDLLFRAGEVQAHEACEQYPKDLIELRRRARIIETTKPPDWQPCLVSDAPGRLGCPRRNWFDNLTGSTWPESLSSDSWPQRFQHLRWVKIFHLRPKAKS
jgi:hypothetical protein